jgi:hypothetical protein
MDRIGSGKIRGGIHIHRLQCDLISLLVAFRAPGLESCDILLVFGVKPADGQALNPLKPSGYYMYHPL